MTLNHDTLRRPVGLQILIAVDFVVFSLGQAYGVIKEAQNTSSNSTFTFVLISLLVCFFSAAASVWAYVGGELARKTLLALVFVNLIWFGYELAILLTYTSLDSFKNIFGVFIIGRILLGFIANGWYLNSAEALAYYYQVSKDK